MLRKLLITLLIVVTVLVSCSNNNDLNNDEIEIEDIQFDEEFIDVKTINRATVLGVNQEEYEAHLFYEDDSVKLKLGNVTKVIEPHPSELPNYSYDLVPLDSMIAVTNHFRTVSGSYVNFDIFSIDASEVQSLFASNKMTCEINDIHFDSGAVKEVSIKLPDADETFEYSLMIAEQERTMDVITELKNNLIEINEELVNETRENIICSPIEVAFVNNPGEKERIIILTNIETVGTKTPVRINSNTVFVYEIEDQFIRFSHVETEADMENENSLFSYFPEKLINQK